MITSQNFDLVSGWKKSATIQWLLKPTFKLFNWAARKRLGRTQRFQLRIKAYKNIVVKTLKFLVKCTDTFLFWQKMPVLEK
jgi:hypothetical protein